MFAGASPTLPEDFEEFWREAFQEANAAPLDYRRSNASDYDLPGFQVETLSFRSISGGRLQGWIAYPQGARRLSSFLWLPPYGRESKLPDAYGTRKGMVSLSFNFHGHEAFHQERYVPERGYFAEGIESPETWIFRSMFQNAVLAARVLQAQVEVDEERIGAMGMSQGAGISIWLGAWCPIIQSVCADMPFMGDIGETLERTVYRYPLKEIADRMETLPLGRERILNTVSYYDTVSHARFCRVPTHVSLGLKDPAARPDNVRKIVEALPGMKKLDIYDWGHDWHPEMIENNLQWLVKTLP